MKDYMGLYSQLNKKVIRGGPHRVTVMFVLLLTQIVLMVKLQVVLCLLAYTLPLTISQTDQTSQVQYLQHPTSTRHRGRLSTEPLITHIQHMTWWVFSVQLASYLLALHTGRLRLKKLLGIMVRSHFGALVSAFSPRPK